MFSQRWTDALHLRRFDVRRNPPMPWRRRNVQWWGWSFVQKASVRWPGLEERKEARRFIAFYLFLCIFRLSFFRVSTSHQFGNIWLSVSSKTSSAQSSQRQRSHPWIQCRAIPTRKSVRRSPHISTTISEMSTWTSASTTTSQRWEFKSRLRRDLLRLREGARETIIYRVTALGGIWCWGCLCARLCCWCAASGSALGECRRTMCWSSLTMASRWR